MSKLDIVIKIEEAGLVAVVRADSPEQAVLISRACIKGGVKAIEVTFTVPNAEVAISQLAAEFNDTDVVIGAGTVLDGNTAKTAISAGAKFVVSPYLSNEAAEVCNAQEIPYMPGAMTLTEAVKCIEAGAAIVKIFPGELFGPAIIKAFRGPMPHLRLMPTGGVSLENVHEWIKAGAVAVGIGSNLTASAKHGDFDTIQKISVEYISKIKHARNK